MMPHEESPGDRESSLPPSPAVPTPSSSHSCGLTWLLQTAREYHQRGAYRQAQALFFELADEHPDTQEGQQARQALLEMAAWYEQHGQLRQARLLYKLLW